MTTTNYSNLEHFKAFVASFPMDQYRHPHFVTLTLKEGLMNDEGGWIRWDPYHVKRNLLYFNNILERRVLGTAAKHGRHLLRAYWLEHTDTKRPHVHGVIDCPRDDKLEVFPDLVASSWRRTLWARQLVDVQVAKDIGAVTYSAKLRDKADYADSYLWENWYLPDFGPADPANRFARGRAQPSTDRCLDRNR